MNKLLILFFLSLFISSCVDESFPGLPELEENLLASGGPDLFTLTDVVQRSRGTNLREVEIRFTSIYEQLSLSQQQQITNLLVITPNRSAAIPIAQNRLVDGDFSVGTEVCFSIAFGTIDANASRAQIFCILVE